MLLMEIVVWRMGNLFLEGISRVELYNFVEPTGEWHRDVNIQKDNDTWKFELKYPILPGRLSYCEQVDDYYA